MSDSDKSPRYNALLFLGAPGSGKGTQGRVLGTVPRFHHCACGDVFRSLDTRTELGREFIEYSSRGELVPDELTVRLWSESIQAKVKTSEFKPDIDFLVLDGIPRNLAQAKLLDEHIKVHQVFHLACPDREELARRLRKRALKDNRIDDANDEVIKHRIATYITETKAVVEYYSPEILSNINAQQHPLKVLQDIIYAITSLPVWLESQDKVLF